jgi:Na+-translocating ferredoxin:NAD+ oxidoreductase RnfG subunit
MNGTKVLDMTDNTPMSGHLILLQKKTWSKIGKFKEDMLVGFDNEIHYSVKREGLKIGLMTGIYLYHWYRGGDGYDKFHIINADVKSF